MKEQLGPTWVWGEITQWVNLVHSGGVLNYYYSIIIINRATTVGETPLPPPSRSQEVTYYKIQGWRSQLGGGGGGGGGG